jgi:hypothetical protein
LADGAGICDHFGGRRGRPLKHSRRVLRTTNFNNVIDL